MGFLNRLRGGAAYGPVAGADDTQVVSTPSDGVGGLSAGATRERPASDAIFNVAPVRGPHALFSMLHRMPGERMTAAERAFMDLKRGSND